MKIHKEIIGENITMFGRNVVYDIHYQNIKRISIAINQIEKKVIVKLPLGESEQTAFDVVKENFDWIIKTLDKCSKNIAPSLERSFTNGSTHLLLGKPYTLKIVESKRGDYDVFIEGDNIIVKCDNPLCVEEFIGIWYKNKSNELVIPIFADMAYDFGNKYKCIPNSLEFKKVKSFWGLCTSKGDVRLNSELVRAPKECIEYIIMHEFCHLIHQDHSKRFYELLEKEMPDWKQRKTLLNNTISARR